MFRAFSKKKKQRTFIAYSTIAQVADSILKQPLKIILPSNSAKYEKDFTDAAERCTYNELVDKIEKMF